MSASECNFLIRRMTDEDLPEVQAIEFLSFANPWNDTAFRNEIRNTSISFPLVVIRTPGNEVVGYVMYWHIREGVQVNNIAVHPDYRGRGIGEALMRHVIKRVRAKGATLMTLEVRPSNTGAIALYRKLGFEVLHTRKDYYTDPREDAYLMSLVLDQQSP